MGTLSGWVVKMAYQKLSNFFEIFKKFWKFPFLISILRFSRNFVNFHFDLNFQIFKEFRFFNFRDTLGYAILQLCFRESFRQTWEPFRESFRLGNPCSCSRFLIFLSLRISKTERVQIHMLYSTSTNGKNAKYAPSTISRFELWLPNWILPNLVLYSYVTFLAGIL